MRPTPLLAVLALAATPALAKVDPAAPPAAAPVPIVLPHAYDGYSQPLITDCQTKSPQLRECTAPAMTAGRYLIEAAADATSTGANATQALEIRVGPTPCVATRPAPFSGREGLHLGCVVSFLTDKPIVVAALYEAKNGTPDPKGPQLAFHRIPWNGVLESRGIVFRAKAAAAPGKAPEKK